MPSAPTRAPRHVVVIPTIPSRFQLLQRSLASVSAQVRPPDRIVVVVDGADQPAVAFAGRDVAIELVQNRRTGGLSGAINTALDHLVRTESDPGLVWVSLLDDDDWWEASYLAEVAAARGEGVFLVGALVRHDEQAREGRPASVSTSIARSSLLIGNPAVQGSNLTVLLGDALRAGGFDEGLSSCTDRDFVIRLLDVGVRPVRVGAAIAHNDTLHGSSRLSDRASDAKRRGLDAFHAKYGEQMSEAQRQAFTARARDFFGWAEPDASGDPPAPPAGERPQPPGSWDPLSFVFGTIVDGDHPRRACGLMDDLARLARTPGVASLEVVALENGAAEGFEQVVHHARARGLRVHPVSLLQQTDVAPGLGLAPGDIDRRKSIAVARTLLQQHVHAVGSGRTGAAAWIVDDDLRFPVELPPLVRDVARLRAGGFDVVIGSTSGAPPIPASAMVRTQLVDLEATLRAIAAGPVEGRLPHESNDNLRRGRRDYYHDLARSETDRLEAHFTPPLAGGATRAEAFADLATQLPRVFAGEALTRPLPVDRGDVVLDAAEGCLRGGNTLIFRWDLLRDVLNLSPRLDGRPVRRSDMVWACDATYRQGAAVVAAPLVLAQDRGFDSAAPDWLGTLIDDVLGYAFFRAYEEHLSKRDGVLPEEPAARRWILHRAQKLGTERFAAVRLSFWRCQGLGRALSSALDEVERSHVEPAVEALRAWRAFVAEVDQRFSPTELQRLEARFAAALQAVGYDAFLSERIGWSAERVAEQVGPILEAWSRTARADAARRVLGSIGWDADEVLGAGREAVVFRAGDRVLKVFDQWCEEDGARHGATLHELSGSMRVEGLPLVRAVHEREGMLVLETMFEPSEAYTGGRGPALVTCLRGLVGAGWVHSNLRPENLRVVGDRLQIIDLGRSVVRGSLALRDAMIRRAFLSWRFSFRVDLEQLLRRSNRDGDFSECVGWEALRDAVIGPAAATVALARVGAWLAERDSGRVLDFGAGKPSSAHLAVRARLVAFDPDPTLAARWSTTLPEVPFHLEWPVGADATAAFHRVLCARVLCAVPDDEMHVALSRIRRSLTPDGEALIVICDPTSRKIERTPTEHRLGASTASYRTHHRYQKRVLQTARPRDEHHRPLGAYRRAFARAGLAIAAEGIVTSTDVERLEAVGDLVLFRLRPLPDLGVSTAMILKVCGLDAATLRHQVAHLRATLAAPRAFDEVVVAFDAHEGSFARPHGVADPVGVAATLRELLEEGLIDRVVEGPRDPREAAAIATRWFALAAKSAHAQNGQATSTFLRTLDTCTADLILHSDIDTLVARTDPQVDLIADAWRIFEAHPRAMTLALPVRGDVDPTPRGADERGPFRVETQVGWLHRGRLERLLPLANELVGDVLQHPWHRALDGVVRSGRAHSLRAGSRGIWYCSPDNARKHDPDALLLALDRVEQGYAPHGQLGHAAMLGPLATWLGPPRSEELVVVACGRNVGPGRLGRFVDSLRTQSFPGWGLVFIDDASDDGTEDVLDRLLRPLGDRVTVVRRRRRVGALANVSLAVRSLVGRPDAIVALVDPDDVLGVTNALELVVEAHRAGADVTVGSMVRTDKATTYEVDFDQPRARRGGNVWQHLRTFRRSLFDRIEDADLRIDGELVDLGSDWAFMLPIVELAERPVWLQTPLYLHEPSSRRPLAERAQREANIARLMARPPYVSRRSPADVTGLVSVVYHRVLPDEVRDPWSDLFRSRGLVVSPDGFERQLRALARDHAFVTLRDVLAAVRGERSLPPRPALVTFDDGYQDFADHALPIARRLGVPLALFARTPADDGWPVWAPMDLVYRGMATSASPHEAAVVRVDHAAREQFLRLELDDQLTLAGWPGTRPAVLEQDRRSLYLNAHSIEGLASRDVCVGTHGVAHVRWTEKSADWLDAELAASSAWLATLPHGVPVLSYPDGACDAAVAHRAREAGFEVAFALAGGGQHPLGAFGLPRHLAGRDAAWLPPTAASQGGGSR